MLRGAFLLGPMRVEAVLSIAVGLVDALAPLHRSRIVHKDVNPDNVLVDDTGLPGAARERPPTRPGA